MFSVCAFLSVRTAFVFFSFNRFSVLFYWGEDTLVRQVNLNFVTYWFCFGLVSQRKVWMIKQRLKPLI